MKKAVIAVAAILIAAVFIPVPKTYADGTKSYNAIAYKAVKWNRPYYKGLIYSGTDVYRFPHSLKSVDELWEGMAIDPAVRFMKGRVYKTDDGRVCVGITDGEDYFRAGDTVDITDFTAAEFEEGDEVEIEYLPETGSEKPEIRKLVDIKRIEDLTEPAVSETDAPESETSPASGEEETRLTGAVPSAKTDPAPALKNTDETKRFIRLYLPYRDGEKYPKVYLIKSVSDWKKFYDGISEYDSSSGLKALNTDYNEKYFKNKAVVAVLTEEGSGSNSYSDITVSSDGKEIRLTRTVPEVGTADMAYWCVLDELDRAHPVFSRNPDTVKVTIEDAKFRGQLPGMIAADVHIGRVDENTLHGLKAEHADAVRKIIGKCSFDSPGYDNISDIIIRTDYEKYYYYDSAGGIVTVNGSPSDPNSDGASKLSDSDRVKLNSIIRNYVSTGITESPGKTKPAGEKGGNENDVDMSFECRDGKTGQLVIKNSGKSGSDVTVGRAYKLEAKDGPGWISYESYVRKNYDSSYRAPNPVFTMEAHIIPPGGEYKETVDFANTYGGLKPGRYRISKTVTIGEGAAVKDKTLYSEFTVEK